MDLTGAGNHSAYRWQSDSARSQWAVINSELSSPPFKPEVIFDGIIGEC